MSMVGSVSGSSFRNDIASIECCWAERGLSRYKHTNFGEFQIQCLCWWLNWVRSLAYRSLNCNQGSLQENEQPFQQQGESVKPVSHHSSIDSEFSQISHSDAALAVVQSESSPNHANCSMDAVDDLDLASSQRQQAHAMSRRLNVYLKAANAHRRQNYQQVGTHPAVCHYF